MVTGLPVIVTRIGGNPELMEEGKAGYLAPKGDIRVFAIYLERYILNSEIMMQHGFAGRERAVK